MKARIHPVVVTVWAMMIFSSRLFAVLFDFSYFSYVVYACFAITIAWLVSRRASGTFRISIRPLWPLALIVVPIVWAGLRGIGHRSEIAERVLREGTDYRELNVYVRTIIITPLLQPMLAALIAISIANGLDARRIIRPTIGFSLLGAIGIIGFTVVSGASLAQLSDRQDLALAQLGFHPNELGALMVLGYALTGGVAFSTASSRTRIWLMSILAVITVAILLTFSRGAYLGFVIVNVIVFARGSALRKFVFVLVVLVVLSILPHQVYERIGLATDTGDLNEISAGRIEFIWLPLLKDISEHMLFGQGLNSIMWTDAQVTETIFPVSIAHNAYLELVLDLGILGALPVLSFYFIIWGRFRRGYRRDNAMHRGLFYGGSLAIVALGIMGTTMDRLIPYSTHFLLWIAVGVLLGRYELLKTKVRYIDDERRSVDLTSSGAGMSLSA